jgi:ubiquinone/menaquinone biosynthesis C-methylase UbiE
LHKRENQQKEAMMEDDVLTEQIAYYRARAQEYDESLGSTQEPQGAFAQAIHLLQHMGPFEQILELACGSGIWTRVLVQMGREVTALDAAPEMLELAKRKLGNAPVRYQQANLFAWEPVQQYDLVFFDFWLSHVPPERLGPFLQRVRQALQPGGSVVLIDQYTPTEEDRQLMKEGTGEPLYAERPLRDGRTFTIVKVFYELATLERLFTTLGFESQVHQLDDSFFLFSARQRQFFPNQVPAD